MYRIGEPEAKRVEKLLESGEMFRYGKAGECDQFEADWGKRLGGVDVRMTTSGTTSLYCALVGMKIGPGDSVIVPACTYMATALAVVAAGAIPIIAEVDESMTLSPEDIEKKIQPHTKAIIPVHMWGLPCDMDAIMEIAERRGVMVLEDACQSVGGGYEGKMLGAIGHAGAYSFNYFKNMTSGEGGAFVTRDEAIFRRGSVSTDCCSYYWNPGEHRPDEQFAGLNFRATEVSGAILNAQLERIDEMLDRMRSHKRTLLKVGEEAGLTSITNHSVDYECGTHLGFVFETEEKARAFASSMKETVGKAFLPIDTGRHVYTRWDPILRKQGAHHPAMNPFNFVENKALNIEYSEDMCPKSLDILSRAVLIGMHPDNDVDKVNEIADAIRTAAQKV
ncbi:MAG: dTDP-4-amino-4,6-dideoxygalactose transaminase [Candidatus Latescibacterota bacterium]